MSEYTPGFRNQIKFLRESKDTFFVVEPFIVHSLFKI